MMKGVYADSVRLSGGLFSYLILCIVFLMLPIQVIPTLSFPTFRLPLSFSVTSGHTPAVEDNRTSSNQSTG